MHGHRDRRRIGATLIALLFAPAAWSAQGEALPTPARAPTAEHAPAPPAGGQGQEADALTLLLGAAAALVFISRRRSPP